MKKLTLALAVGVMYLGTQATVVFAQKPGADSTIGERKTCQTCGAVTNNVDSKQQAAGKQANRGSATPGSKDKSSAKSARGEQ